MFAVSNGSGSSLAFSQTSTDAAASGFNHVVISIDEGVTNGSIIYLNDSTSDTFSANYSSPSTSAATYKVQVRVTGSTGGINRRVANDDTCLASSLTVMEVTA